MKVVKSIEISAPPERIWPFMVEPEKILQWYYPLQEFKYTSKQHGGHDTRLYLEEKVAGRVMKLNCEVTGWAVNQRVAFRMTSGNIMKSYEERWTVDPTPSGSRFTFMEQGKLPFGLIGQIMGLFAQRGSAATVGKMLSRLKGLAEAQA